MAPEPIYLNLKPRTWKPRTWCMIIGGLMLFGAGEAAGGTEVKTVTVASPAKAAQVAASTPTVTSTLRVPGPVKTVRAAPLPAKTVTIKPDVSSCTKALDLTASVLLAVGDEHDSMGTAAIKASEDGDVITFMRTMNRAVTKLNDRVDGLAPELAKATAACRSLS